MGELYKYAEGWSPFFLFVLVFFLSNFIYLYILHTSHFTPAPDNMKRAKSLKLRRVQILGESTHWGLRKEVRANIYAKSHVRERHLNSFFVAPQFRPSSAQLKKPTAVGGLGFFFFKTERELRRRPVSY